MNIPDKAMFLRIKTDLVATYQTLCFEAFVQACNRAFILYVEMDRFYLEKLRTFVLADKEALI